MLQPNALVLRDLAQSVEVEQLEENLRQMLRGKVWEFSIRLFDGGLILRGNSDSYYGKQLAQHAVMKAIDLPIRENQILVNWR